MRVLKIAIFIIVIILFVFFIFNNLNNNYTINDFCKDKGFDFGNINYNLNKINCYGYNIYKIYNIKEWKKY